MPVKYAIRTRLPDAQLTEQEQYMMDYNGWSIPEEKFSYEEVPPVVAECDEENGVYAYFSEQGVKLSQWLLCSKPKEVRDLWHTGRTKPGPTLKDSIGQDIKQGDYLFTHTSKQEELELCQVVRNLKLKTQTENLSCPKFVSSKGAIKSRNPESYFKLPIEMIEGGVMEPFVLEKRFVLYEAEGIAYVGIRETITPTDEKTAMTDERGHYGYWFNDELVTGWVPCKVSPEQQAKIDSASHGKKRVYQELDTPMKDAMGTDILLDDWVFSNDNNNKIFMLCKVIGFTKDRVRLVGYMKDWTGMQTEAYRFISINYPANILKVPLEIKVLG